MRISMILLLSICSLSLFSQEELKNEYRADINFPTYFDSRENVWFKPTSSAYGIKGTRFVFEEFQKASIYFTDMILVPDKLLNYDCYMDHVVYSEGEDRYILDKYKIDYLEFYENKDSSIYFKKIMVYEENDIVFMQIMFSGDVSLYKRYSKTLVIKDEQPTFNYDDRYSNEYIQNITYYLDLPGKDYAILIPQNKRNLLKLFEQKEQEIKDFIKTEKIKLNNENDLIKLVKYYNGLLKKSEA